MRMGSQKSLWKRGSALATACLFGLSVSSGLRAQTASQGGGGSDVVKGPFTINASPYFPNGALYAQNAQYATGGVSLRNKRSGLINISGVNGTIRKAILYWAYVYNTTTPPGLTQALPSFCRVMGLTYGASFICTSNISGKRTALQSSPCWGGNGLAVYAADVTRLVTTNGSYIVNLSATQSGSNTSTDPWDATTLTFPLAEGASLVVIGTGDKTVAVYDNFPDATFNKSLTYTLQLPPTAPVNGGPVLFDHIGADGQTGLGRTTQYIGETIEITGNNGGTPVKSYGDWNGVSGQPLPQLWDDTGHDVTEAAPATTTALTIKHTSPKGDCLAPVANIVSYK